MQSTQKRIFRKYSCRGVDIDMLLDHGGPTQPEPIKTDVRNMAMVPEMIGSGVGVYNMSNQDLTE